MKKYFTPGSIAGVGPLLSLFQPQGLSVGQSPLSSLSMSLFLTKSSLSHLPEIRLQSCPLPAAWLLLVHSPSLWEKGSSLC